MSTSIKFTRDLFLKLLSLVYLLSFLSIFYQIQGLWADEGILPAKDLIEKMKNKIQPENLKSFHILNFSCLSLFSFFKQFSFPIFSFFDKYFQIESIEACRQYRQLHDLKWTISISAEVKLLPFFDK